MQRYNVNLKGGTYAQGLTYRAIPIMRQQVVPGQTVNLACEVSLKSAALNRNITTPSIMSMWFFYVPHRLVFDEWTDWVSQEKDKPSLPIADAAGFIFEKGERQVSALARRAYKLIYNEFFGTEQLEFFGIPNYAWFGDITDDNNNNYSNRLRTPAQFMSKLVTTDTSEDPEFAVSSSSIPLNEFYRRMMNARSQQRAQMTGNKYVDTLARMGVDASWMISERPEFLGTKSKMVGPALTTNTSNTDTAFEVGRYQAKLSCEIKNKHFAEHGYLIGIAGMRPILLNTDENPADIWYGEPTLSTSTQYQPAYLSDNLQSRDTIFDDVMGVSGNAYSQRFSYLTNGQWLTAGASAESWITEYDPTEVSTVIYPTAETVNFSSELGGDQVAITSSFSITGKTPVKKSVA